MKRFRASPFAFIALAFALQISAIFFLSLSEHLYSRVDEWFGWWRISIIMFICLPLSDYFFLCCSTRSCLLTIHNHNMIREDISSRGMGRDEERCNAFHYSGNSIWAALCVAFYAATCTLSLPHVIHYESSSHSLCVMCRSKMVEGQTCTKKKTYQLIAYFSYLLAAHDFIALQPLVCLSTRRRERAADDKHENIFLTRLISWHTISLSYSSVCCCSGVSCRSLGVTSK